MGGWEARSLRCEEGWDEMPRWTRYVRYGRGGAAAAGAGIGQTEEADEIVGHFARNEEDGEGRQVGGHDFGSKFE